MTVTSPNSSVTIRLVIPVAGITVLSLVVLGLILPEEMTVGGVLLRVGLLMALNIAALWFIAQQMVSSRLNELYAYLLQVVSTEVAPSKPLRDDGSDEIGAIVNTLTDFVKDLKSVIDEVRSGAHQVRESSEHQASLMLESVEKVGDRTTQVEQVARTFGDVASLSEQLSVTADQIAESTKGVVNLLRDGNQSSRENQTAVSDLSVNVDSMSDDAAKLQEETARIGSVLDVIKGIAEQTNLLALNAAIEAARAGEQGRGFAVVADEVRTLANRTRQSTAEINSMLETIVSSISQAVTSMESNQTQAGQAVELAQMTVESLSSIQSNILTLSDDSQQVASMAEQSCNQVVEMRAAVEDFKAVGDSVVQSSIETRETSNKMTELAASLEQSVGRFRT